MVVDGTGLESSSEHLACVGAVGNGDHAKSANNNGQCIHKLSREKRAYDKREKLICEV
jgi:hypothetical protein